MVNTNLLNNYVFQLLGTLTTAGTTVSISTEKETGAVVSFTDAYIVMTNLNGTKIERMKATAAAGTLTTSIRGLPKDQSMTPDSTLYKNWTDGTVVYVTVLAQNYATLQDENAWTGVNTRAAASTFNATVISNALTTVNAGFIVAGTTSYIKFPELTTAQRNALTPSNGFMVYDTTLNLPYIYKGGAWAPVDTGAVTPNASTAVAGSIQLSTFAETDALTTTGSTGAQLVTQQDYIPVSTKSSLADNDKFVIYDSATSNTKKGMLASTIIANVSAAANPVLNFGNGADGDVTISAGTTTLTRDMFYNNLTIDNGGILKPDGYKILVRGTLTIAVGGNIDRSGNAGGAGGDNSGASGGVAGAAATMLNQGTLADMVTTQAGTAALPAGTGTSGINAAAATAANPSYSNVTGAAGGDSQSVGGNPVGTGAAGGTSTRGALYQTLYKGSQLVSLISNPASWANFFLTTTYKSLANSGAGAASGASGGSGGGGGGAPGGNAGTIWIAANIFNNLGTVTAIGGAGGAGGNGAAQGGGGGGGNGGIFYLIYSTLTNLGTVTLTGGAGGASAGTPGGTGSTGVTISIQV